MGSTICFENRDHQYDDLYDNFGKYSNEDKNITIKFYASDMYLKKYKRRRTKRKKHIVNR